MHSIAGAQVLVGAPGWALWGAALGWTWPVLDSSKAPTPGHSWALLPWWECLGESIFKEGWKMPQRKRGWAKRVGSRRWSTKVRRWGGKETAPHQGRVEQPCQSRLKVWEGQSSEEESLWANCYWQRLVWRSDFKLEKGGWKMLMFAFLFPTIQIMKSYIFVSLFSPNLFCSQQ